jgi:hypothetical protein
LLIYSEFQSSVAFSLCIRYHSPDINISSAVEAKALSGGLIESWCRLWAGIIPVSMRREELVLGQQQWRTRRAYQSFWDIFGILLPVWQVKVTTIGPPVGPISVGILRHPFPKRSR